MSVNIGGIAVGGDNQCRFVAELGNAANGSLERFLRLVTAAKDAGADFVKAQLYTPDEIIALRGDGPAPAAWSHMTMRELYTKAATPSEWFYALDEYCRDLEIPWFASSFGLESLAFLESLGVPCHKLARLDNRSAALRDAMRATGKPLIVSELNAGECISEWTENVVRLRCPVGYPQERFDFKQRYDSNGDYQIATFDLFDGFSYHGVDPLPCIVAATLGAKIVEAHFQLRDEPSELEANVSLHEYQFAEMVATVRRIEGMMA